MLRLERLQRRRIDDSMLVRASMVNEVYRQISGSDSVKYAIGAMQPIDPEYTRNTYAQGERVQGQLKERLVGEHTFEFQGSVTTDTHIKARSDIDLLVIQTAWVRLQHPQVPQNPYKGDTVQDIRNLRSSAATALAKAFPAASVDTSGSTALSLSGGSLTREVDVVPASWYDTNDYAATRDSTLRGVEVFNNETGQFVQNTPFLHKRRIEERDQLTRGGLRRAVRLMKSLMYDSEGRVDMSSYNITCIAYNISEAALVAQRPRELLILESCFEYCEQLRTDNALRDSIRVPDGHRTVFGSSPGASKAQLDALSAELGALRRDIINDNARSFAKLAEARVDYGVPRMAS